MPNRKILLERQCGEQELPALVNEVKEILSNFPVLLSLKGEMGAGKTTFSTKLFGAFGVDEKEVASPTYSLVNEYASGNTKHYHLDLFRLKDEEELYDIGMEDMLSSDFGLMLVEWAEMLLPLIDSKYFELEITKRPEGRMYVLSEVFTTFT